MESADPPADSSVPSVVDAFGIDDPAPYEVQQTVHRYLSQETRHNILQVILGHPSHLVSTTEFAYYVPGSRSAISDQFADLADHEIVTQDHHESNTDSRDIPAEFWGLTEFGVALLHEYNYLRGLPVVRAVHDATRKKPRGCSATRAHRVRPSRLRFTTHSTTTNQRRRQNSQMEKDSLGTS